MPYATQILKAALLTTFLLTSVTSSNAEIIIGIDDPDNPSNTINTDITNFHGRPVDINNFTSGTTLIIGYNSVANLQIDNQSILNTTSTYIGYNTDSIGIVNVQDTGTIWELSSSLTVGYYGQALLNITNNATVKARFLRINKHGNITINNGIINADNIHTQQISKITGTGTINTFGRVYDHDLTLQNLSDLQFTHTITNENQNLTINTDLSQASQHFGAGNSNQATVNIQNGLQTNSFFGYIGIFLGSNGTINIQDPDSSWKVNNTLYIGEEGQGTLNISNGATASTGSVYMGYKATANGTANIHGPGSLWTIGYDLSIGKNGQGALNISNNATVTTGADIHIGEEGQGELHISSGATVTTGAYAHIGFNTSENNTAKGNVNIQGENSSWNIANTLYIGNHAQGSLNISDGATVTADALQIYNGQVLLDNGTLNVKKIRADFYPKIIGNGTINTQGRIYDQNITLKNQSDLQFSESIITENQNLIINNNLTQESLEFGAGNSSQAVINIQNGTQINSQNGAIGLYSNANGTINIQDQGSIWTTRRLNIGSFGKGTLNITNGATVIANRELNIGQYSGANGTINLQGENTSLNISYSLNVGVSGQGVLNISDGATATSGTTHISSYAGSSGIINIQDLGSNWTTNDIYFGYNGGHGTFNITNGATVKSHFVYIATNINLNGFVNLQGSGSSWSINNDFNIGWGQANINISNQAQLIINNDFIIENNDDTTLNLSLTSIDDPFIDIHRNADIAGQLNILTDNLTDLTLGDTFLLLDISGNRFGTFSNLSENDIAGYYNNLALRLTYLGGDGNDIALITTAAPQLGDTNDDGQINQLDLDLVQQHLGTDSYLGDANHDGTVNLQDLFAVRNNFRNTPTSIPEPTTLLTLLIIAPLTLRRRSR